MWCESIVRYISAYVACVTRYWRNELVLVTCLVFSVQLVQIYTVSGRNRPNSRDVMKQRNLKTKNIVKVLRIRRKFVADVLSIYYWFVKKKRRLQVAACSFSDTVYIAVMLYSSFFDHGSCECMTGFAVVMLKNNGVWRAHFGPNPSPDNCWGPLSDLWREGLCGPFHPKMNPFWIVWYS